MPTFTIKKTPSVGKYTSPIDGMSINEWVQFLISKSRPVVDGRPSEVSLPQMIFLFFTSNK